MGTWTDKCQRPCASMGRARSLVEPAENLSRSTIETGIYENRRVGLARGKRSLNLLHNSPDRVRRAGAVTLILADNHGRV